jgi:predicted peptidase
MRLAAKILACCVLVSGCASNPDKIKTAYVSPLKYANFSCAQIAAEMDHIGRSTTQLYQSLQSESKADNWQMGVGLLLFWPSLFFLEGGDGPEAAEYSQLKGDYEALRQASNQKECMVSARSPEDIIKEAEKLKKSKPEVISEAATGEAIDDDAAIEKYRFAARKFSISLGCMTGVELLKSGPEFEVYASSCDGNQGVIIQCKADSCEKIE